MATKIFEEGMEFSKYVGAEVRADAGRKKLSIARLAREATMDRSTLIRYLDGVRPFPLDALYAVAEVLDVSPETFVSEAYKRFLLDNPDMSAHVAAEVVALYTPVEGVPVIDINSRRRPPQNIAAKRDYPAHLDETE